MDRIMVRLMDYGQILIFKLIVTSCVTHNFVRVSILSFCFQVPKGPYAVGNWF